MKRKNVRIAVIGMPGTGKTEFADALAQELHDSEGPEWEIIDDYAQEMADDLKLHVGPESSYLPNLMIFCKRAWLEQKAKIEGKNYITVGTDLDTIAYLAVQIELYSQQPKTEQMMKRIQRSSYAAFLLSFGLEDLFEYDYVFYCPVPERFKIVVPGDLNSVEQYPEHLIWVDDALRTTYTKWGLNPAKLVGTTDERVKQALDVIDRLNDESKGG